MGLHKGFSLCFENLTCSGTVLSLEGPLSLVGVWKLAKAITYSSSGKAVAPREVSELRRKWGVYSLPLFGRACNATHITSECQS